MVCWQGKQIDIAHQLVYLIDIGNFYLKLYVVILACTLYVNE